MKVIFLDIDGVLNIDYNLKDEYHYLFNKDYVNNLAYIIEKTDAKIVISSSIRIIGLDKLQDMWEYRKLPGEVIDITPLYIDSIYDEDNLITYDIVNRGTEIHVWLINNNITNYCIVDDIDDMLNTQKKNFVLTKDGLTRKCAYKIINILNKE